jgi:8-oxo-dGTP pyrophosphatase MutT (NUDIX family)
MKTYIENYRAQNYPGFIQVIKLTAEGETWLYDARNSIEEDLIAHGYFQHNLSAVKNFDDYDENLDVTELVFTKDFFGKPTFENRYQQPLKKREIPYYKQIQQFIGKDTIFSCGIGALIENKNHQIAIAKRADFNIWAFPGGAKELHEPIHITLENEIREELGLEIKNPLLFAIASGNSFRVTYPSGGKMHYLLFLFKVDYKSGSLKANDHENTDTAWADQDELLNMLSERHLRFWETYKRFSGTVLIN